MLKCARARTRTQLTTRTSIPSAKGRARAPDARPGAPPVLPAWSRLPTPAAAAARRAGRGARVTRTCAVLRSNVVPHPVRARGCGSPGYPAAVAASTELRLGVEPVDPSVFGPSHRTAVALWYSSGTAVSKYKVSTTKYEVTNAFRQRGEGGTQATVVRLSRCTQYTAAVRRVVAFVFRIRFRIAIAFAVSRLDARLVKAS